ncbi:MAG: WD40-repeat-containing domain protein [Benniella sp.]|nr:MAG: WD40-repeat-containing domain protein [Benniella sp.]
MDCVYRGMSWSAEFSPQEDLIAPGSDDRTVRLWNVETRACTRTLAGHDGWIKNVAYSRQGHQLASTSNDYTVKLWDVMSGECRRTLNGRASKVYGAMYSPSGSEIARFIYSPQGNQAVATNDDGTVRVWDIGTWECRHIFIGGKVGVWSVTYSPKGDQITAGGQDGSVRIWDTTAMASLCTLSGHSALVRRIVYSSQGNLVISASCDMSSSGINYLVAGCGDGVMGMWHVLVDHEHCDVSLSWKTSDGELDMNEATIQDVQGLSQLNRKLLKQRGAVGDATDRLREASKKVTTMVSVATKPKASSEITVEEPSYTISYMVKGLERKFGQTLQQAKDSLIQVLVAVL